MSEKEISDKMQEIMSRIKQRREQLEMSYQALSDKTGMSKSTLQRYETGQIKNMPIDKLDAIAEALGVSPSYLMGWTDSITPPKSEHQSWRIPIVATVAAGTPIFSEENIEGYTDFDRDPRGNVYVAHVKGHSMEPGIHDGDLIIVDKGAVWDDGDIVLVTVNGNEGTCKRIRKYADGIRLIPLNPTYDPIDFSREQVEQLPVTVMGKVVESRKKW